MGQPVKGLSAEARKAMLDEEMGDGDGEVEITPTPPPQKLEPEVPVAAPLPAVAPDMTALIQALVTGITQSNAGTAEAIKEALGSAASMARTPIPEDAVSPGVSVFSHPDGDRAHARTKLRCPMFLGVYDDDGKVDPAFEIYEDTCTESERTMLNDLRAGVYPRIERNDGITATWRVVQKTDDNGGPVRLVIAVPVAWLGQDQFQQMPTQPNFLRQLLAAQSAAA